EIIDTEEAAASVVTDVIQEERAIALFEGRSFGVEDANGVDLDIGFLDGGADLIFCVAAVIVAAVGNDEEGFALVFCLLHLFEAEVDGIEQGGAMAGLE